MHFIIGNIVVYLRQYFSEDIDPTVGRFRNLVQTEVVIPTKVTHAAFLVCSFVMLVLFILLRSTVILDAFTQFLRLRLHGTLKQFSMEPFRIGTDRLPVYTISWNRSVQNRSFQSIHA